MVADAEAGIMNESELLAVAAAEGLSVVLLAKTKDVEEEVEESAPLLLIMTPPMVVSVLSLVVTVFV